MRRNSLNRLRERGVATVEAALLVLPFLLVLVFGIVDGGRAIYQYNTLVKSARDSVRYLSTMEKGTGYATATCLATTGSPTCAGPALVEGFTSANVSICDASTCRGTHGGIPSDGNGGAVTGVINLVTVTISNFQFQSIVGFPFPSIVFDPISATMRQAL